MPRGTARNQFPTREIAVVTREAVEGALRALDTGGHAEVLDVLADSDVDTAWVHGRPRRLRFGRGDLVLDLVVHETDEANGLQVLLRVTPRSPYVVVAQTRRRDLAVEAGVTARGDAGGVARVIGLPHGLTSLQLEGLPRRPRARTAWIRL